jgi:hypothetical protein
MLRDSIATFKHFFRAEAEYLVLTDNPKTVTFNLGALAKVRNFEEAAERVMFDDSRTTWKKWSPTARLAPDAVEILLDADVFCVGEPVELMEFCRNGNGRICALQESAPEPWCYGAFFDQLTPTTPPINSGLVAQQPGANISERLSELFHWWLSSVPAHAKCGHDEQGAVAVVMMEAAKLGKAFGLPTDRYILTSPRTNPNLGSLKDLAVIHATHPTHPKYFEFQNDIRAIFEVASTRGFPQS